MPEETVNPVHDLMREQLRALMDEFHAADTEAERTAILARLLGSSRALADGKRSPPDH